MNNQLYHGQTSQYIIQDQLLFLKEYLTPKTSAPRELPYKREVHYCNAIQKHYKSNSNQPATCGTPGHYTKTINQRRE